MMWFIEGCGLVTMSDIEEMSSSLLKTDTNLSFKVFTFMVLSECVIPVFALTGATPVLSFFLLLMKLQSFFSFWRFRVNDVIELGIVCWFTSLCDLFQVFITLTVLGFVGLLSFLKGHLFLSCELFQFTRNPGLVVPSWRHLAGYTCIKGSHQFWLNIIPRVLNKTVEGIFLQKARLDGQGLSLEFWCICSFPETIFLFTGLDLFAVTLDSI